MQYSPQPKRKRRLWLWALGILLVLVLIIGIGTAIGNAVTASLQAQPTQPAATLEPTQALQVPTTVPATATSTPPTEAPTQKIAPIPKASELSQLFSAKDGKVTDVNVTPNASGTGVALDIQVYNPTQAKVKHINYILMQFFFGARNDVSALNFAFHADGYTGMDDPIANCAGVASEYSLGYDENQLWNALFGVFNANLPA